MCQVFSPLIGPKFSKKKKKFKKRRPEEEEEEEVQKRAVRVSFFFSLPFFGRQQTIYVQWHAFVTHWPYLVSLRHSGYLKKMKMEQRGRFLRRPRGEPQCHVAPVCQWRPCARLCSSLLLSAIQFNSTDILIFETRCPASRPLNYLDRVASWLKENPAPDCIPLLKVSGRWEATGAAV